MTTAIDQKSYLQKYLGGPSGDKKKKKKKNLKGKGFKIIDDDLDLSKLRPLDGDELDILNQGEDAPQIAGIIDERPEELRKMEAFQTSSKWRVITQDDGFNSKLKVEEVKRNIKEVEKENEIVFGKMYSDSEDEQKNESDASLPRRNETKESNTNKNQKHSSDSDFSPPRKNYKSKHSKTYDSDVSPPRKNAKEDKASSSSPRHKNSTENSKSKTKDNPDQSPLRKHSKNAASNDKRSRIDQTDSKRSKNQNDNDASPQRRKDENQNKHRVRKPSRWGDFNDESNHRAASPKNRSEKRNSPDRHRNENNSSKKYSNDSDVSPPRKSRRDSPKRNRTPDSDESPQRKRKQSPDKRKKVKYRDSTSPKRNKIPKYSEQTKRSHESSKRRHKSDSDVSPPRQERNKSDSKRNDVKRSKKRDTDSDSSPARQGRSKIYNKRTANRSNRQDSDSDVSPPRKERNKNDSRSKRKDSDSDLSPPRKGPKPNDKRNANKNQRLRIEISDSDLSPPRKERKNYQERRDEPSTSNKKMDKTLEGKQAGLQDARQLKQENESFRRREDEAFRHMTDEMSGRNAKIVSRKGKRDTSEDRQKQREKAERQKVLDEKYKQWSKGLKQIESQQAAVQDFIHEASKPLARYKDDRDLETKLKDVERQGDPMLKYIREKKRERGELGPEKPMYKGNFPPNRFNIRPGYRWDGVDRSNGYENKYFAQQSKRKAQEEEVYKWSTEDL